MLPRLPPAVLGSLILLLLASLMGLILAGRPGTAVLAHPDVAAVQAIGVPQPGWQTVVLLSERETDLPAEALRRKVQAVADWSDWSRSTVDVSERLDGSDNGMIRFRIKLGYGLFPVDYTAPILTETAEALVWGRVQPGAATLFAWRLSPGVGGRTRVSLTAYLASPAYGALRAVLEAEGQAEVDRIVTHLLTAAR